MLRILILLTLSFALIVLKVTFNWEKYLSPKSGTLLVTKTMVLLGLEDNAPKCQRCLGFQFKAIAISLLY
jgi:hypothetical protein